MRYPSGIRARWSWLHGPLANAIILILSLTVTLLALEAVTRFIYRDIRSTGDGRSYFSARDFRQNPPQLNRFGFREREFATSASDDRYPIAVIGDSFIAGQGIRDADRLTNSLERHLDLASSEVEFEVLNFGIRGSDTDDHIKILENVVLGASPQFVLLGWYVNDVRADRDLRWSSIPLIPWRRAHGFALRHSALYYLADQRWIDLQHRLGLILSEEEFLSSYFADANSPYARRAEMLLQRFIDVCQKKKIPMGIVLFPRLRRNQNGRFDLGFLLDRVLQVCSQHHITCVDLRSAFETVDVANLRVNQFDHHITWRPRPSSMHSQRSGQPPLGNGPGSWARGAPRPQLLAQDLLDPSDRLVNRLLGLIPSVTSRLRVLAV
jgi:hypothetical protein